MRLESKVASATRYVIAWHRELPDSHFDLYKSAYHKAATKYDAFAMLY